MFEPAAPHPLGRGGQRVLLEVRAAQTVQFRENFLEQKLKNTPYLVGVGQVRSGLRPHLGVRREVQVQRGASPDMVPWLSGIQLGREMCTHPGSSTPRFGLGTATPGVRGPKNGVRDPYSRNSAFL